jgi:hypothetical protein
MFSIANREVAYLALFSKLTALGTFKLVTRRLKHWQDTAPEDQPALFMEHNGEVTQQVRGQPARVVLEVSLWIYVRSNGQEVGPVLNPILDVVSDALAPPKNGDHTQTLNGVVHHCWIEGQTQIFEGDLGEEAVAIIPVKLLVT